MQPLLYLRWWQSAGWALVGLVTVLSLVPSPPETLSFQGGDKVLHLAAYTGLTLWFGAIYLPGQRRYRMGAFLILMGLILELAQGVIGYRSLQGLDMIANTLGVGLGLLLSRTGLSRAFVFAETRILGHARG
jgi:VanZ family protein